MNSLPGLPPSPAQVGTLGCSLLPTSGGSCGGLHGWQAGRSLSSSHRLAGKEDQLGWEEMGWDAPRRRRRRRKARAVALRLTASPAKPAMALESGRGAPAPILLKETQKQLAEHHLLGACL